MTVQSTLELLLPDSKLVSGHKGLSMTRNIQTFYEVIRRLPGADPVHVTECKVYTITRPSLPWSHQHEFVLAVANVGGMFHFKLDDSQSSYYFIQLHR